MHIELRGNLNSKEIQQKNIPCLCKVAKEFEIEFLDPLPEATGVVQGWDWKLYKVIDLAMFDTSFGWCPVLQNGEYGPPGKFYDDDDEDDDIGR